MANCGMEPESERQGSECENTHQTEQEMKFKENYEIMNIIFCK